MQHELTVAAAPQALRLLVVLSEKVSNPDYAGICQRLMFLDDAPEVASILSRLLNGPEVGDPLMLWDMGPTSSPDHLAAG